MEFNHLPVMLNECIEGLNIKSEGTYIDATLGGAGHSSEIAKRLSAKGSLIGIDKDGDAVKISLERLAGFACKIKIVNRDFKDYKQILNEAGIVSVEGILIDLGVSSYQIDSAERGFSYRQEGPLDMRMDKTNKFSAETVVNDYSYDQLVKIFYEYGEENLSKQIAKNIVKARDLNRITTTLQLVKIIETGLPIKKLIKNNTVAKIFQAIRIEVNGELEGLSGVLKEMIDSLSVGGRMCVISFHSLEDRVVKNIFRDASTGCICPKHLPVCVCNHKEIVKIINKKPIIPSSKEIKENTRSASAKLRVIEKL